MQSSPADSSRPSARRWPETDLKIKFGYIVADGSIWKFSRAELARLAAGEYFADIKPSMSSPALNHSTGEWRNVPAALYSLPGDSRIDSAQNGHEVGPGMDDAAEHPEWAARLLARGVGPFSAEVA